MVTLTTYLSCDTFSQIIRAKKAMSRRTFFFSVQYLEFYVKTYVSLIVLGYIYLCNTEYFCIVDSAMQLNNKHRMYCCVSTAIMFTRTCHNVTSHHIAYLDMIYLTAIGQPPGGSSSSTHIHTNNTENDTKQTIHRTTQKIHRTTQKLGRVRAVSRLCGFHPDICLTTEEKARKTLSQGNQT